MTVRELILELEKYDEDMIVLIYGEEEDGEIAGIENCDGELIYILANGLKGLAFSEPRG